MSLLASFSKRNKLNATIKQMQQARKSEGNVADQLYKAAYQGYAEVMQDDPLRADTLYNWGFALLHHAKSKSGEQAAKIYQDAISKFTFCMLINPSYLAAAVNGGVAYMDLARLLAVKPDDELYTQAQKQFESANAIQSGTASYNLACIFALRNDQTACHDALENAKSKGVLPEVAEILNDPDLNNVKEQNWFLAFIESIPSKTVTKPEEPVITEETVVEENTPANEENDSATTKEVNTTESSASK